MRIGISILTREGQSIWQNGIEQNVFFLADCLWSIGFVQEVILIDCGLGQALPDDAGSAKEEYVQK